MKKLFLYFLLSVSCISQPISAEVSSKQTSQTNPRDEEFVIFTPPAGWKSVEPAFLPEAVIAMVVDDRIHPYRPSMNLAVQKYSKTLKDYLKVIKSKEDAKGNLWREIDTIKTNAGPASLSQVDEKTEWGVIRHMYLILLKSNKIYVLSAAATSQDFSKNYKEFFKAMRSLRVCESLNEAIPTQGRKTEVKNAYAKVQNQWNTLFDKRKKEKPETSSQELKKEVFESEEFQNQTWKPFKEMIEKQYADLGSVWQNLYLQKSQNDLY